MKVSFKKHWRNLRNLNYLKYFLKFTIFCHNLLKKEPSAKIPWKIFSIFSLGITSFLFYGFIFEPTLLSFEIHKVALPLYKDLASLCLIVGNLTVIFLFSISDTYFPRYYIVLSMCLLALPWVIIKFAYGSFSNWWNKFLIPLSLQK